MALGPYPAPSETRKRSASAVILCSRTKQSNPNFSAALGSYPAPPGARKRSASAVILRSRTKQSNQGFSVALGPYPAPSETRKRSASAVILCSRTKQSNQNFSVALGPYPTPPETRKRSGKNLVFPREPAAASPSGMMVISALGRNNTPRAAQEGPSGFHRWEESWGDTRRSGCSGSYLFHDWGIYRRENTSTAKRSVIPAT